MRIYRKSDFLKLPVGTIYARGVRWSFAELAVKRLTISDSDWFSHPLIGIDASDSEELFDRMEEMLASGTSYPMNDAEERDGEFDPLDLFLVYELDDLRILRDLITEAVAIAYRNE